MDKVFVDTNIVLDLLSKREQFYPEAQQLFSMADKKKVKLYISSLTFANTYYILSRGLKSDELRTVLRKFKLLVKILPMDDKIIDLALNSDFKDFEDAIQYYTAIEGKLNLIITRNLRDFKLAKIPVMAAKDYMSLQ